MVLPPLCAGPVTRGFGAGLITVLPLVLGLGASAASAQVVLPSASDPTPIPTTTEPDAPIVSVDRIKRALETSPEQESRTLRYPDLHEYVLVIGALPKRPLFTPADLTGPAPYGKPTRELMNRVMPPRRLSDILVPDTRWDALAALAAGLAVPGVTALARSLFSRGAADRPPAPPYSAYSETFVVGPVEPQGSPQVLLFHRMDGQRVSLSLRSSCGDACRFEVLIDDERLGLFAEPTAQVDVPSVLLRVGRIGNLHSVKVRAVPRAAGEDDGQVEVLVIVHAVEASPPEGVEPVGPR